jgi:hypothetical protein
MTRSNGGTVQYGVPIPARHASKRPSAGRRCEVQGCVTLLSTYNASTTCWLHTTATRRHPLAPATETA